MLKFIFICLVIANALLLAVWRGYFASSLLEEHQPQRLMNQHHSDHLKLISAELATAPPKVVAPPPPQTSACLEWGAFQKNDLTRVEAKLKPLLFGPRQSRHNAQDTASTIVFIPPLGSKAAAQKKADELVELGIKDFYIIQDQSSLRWGISLGLFKSEEAARHLLTSLTNKGVRSAKIASRTAVSNKFNYVFKEVSNAEKADLEKLKKEFPEQGLRVCD